jgi:hypothetical protein
MKLFSRITLVLTVLILLGAGGAKADTLLSFDLTGPTTATFELYAHPLISPGDADPGGGFTVDPIDLKINGVASNDFLAFYSSANDMGGAFAAFSDDFDFDFSLTGPQVYSGHEWAPVFRPTSGMSMTDFVDGNGAYTLTISPVSTSEPSSALLLGMALLLPLGLGLQRLR